MSPGRGALWVVLAVGGILLAACDQEGVPGQAAAPQQGKYTAATLPTCAEIAKRVPGMPPLSDHDTFRESVPHSTEFKLLCAYVDHKPAAIGARTLHKFTLTVRAFQNKPGSVFASGDDEARATFEAGLTDGGVVQRPAVGERSAWMSERIGQIGFTRCGLMILDANAVLQVTRWGQADAASQTDDPTSRICREPTLALAKRFYKALQSSGV